MADHPAFPLPLDEKGVPIDPPPPRPEQVMAFALAIRSTRKMRAIFERLGKWGLPTAEEHRRLDAFRADWLARHGMAHLNLNGFFGADMLFRRIAWGQVGGLESPEAMRLLEAEAGRNTIERMGANGVSTVPTRIDEVMWLANTVVERCSFWPALADDMRHQGDPSRRHQGDHQLELFWYRHFAPAYGQINRGASFPVAMAVLREIANGRIDVLASKDAWLFVNGCYPTLFGQIVEAFDV